MEELDKGSQSVELGPAAHASPGNLLKMQISDLPNQKLWGWGLESCGLISPSGNFNSCSI